jgi:hypothetical protein
MTTVEMHAQGLMGCATCYRVFAASVAQATAELHGSRAAAADAGEPPATSAAARRPSLPWPTRRAEAHPVERDAREPAGPPPDLPLVPPETDGSSRPRRRRR